MIDKVESRDVNSKLLEQSEKLPNLKNLQKGIVKKLREGNQYQFVLPVENIFKASLGETTKDIELTIYSFYSMVRNLNNKSISIAIYPHINNISITQYHTKVRRNQLIEEVHSFDIGGHEEVTNTNNKGFPNKGDMF